jgi:hypothetical protein
MDDGRKEAIENLTAAVRYWRDSPPDSDTTGEPAYVRPQAERDKIESICRQMEELGPYALEMDFDLLWQQLLELKVTINSDLRQKVSAAFFPFRDKFWIDGCARMVPFSLWCLEGLCWSRRYNVCGLGRGLDHLVFGRAQYRVAAAQKNIALDKLKFDVFEHRYRIYTAAKELCELLLRKENVENAEWDKMYALFVTLDEARFYFDPTTIKVLDDLILFARHYYFRHVPDVRIVPVNEESARALLFDTYKSLPKQFERALAFVELKK